MSKTKIVAIIQARLESSRLPLKAFLNLHGLPLIDWTLTRVARAGKLDSIVVAVPDTEMDLLLKKHVEAAGAKCVQGPENDVLERFCMAAKKLEAGHVVRVCADNPLIWGEAIDRLIDFYWRNPCDYAYNHVPRGNLWPDGLGAEIVSRELLEELGEKARQPAQREHCLNYIWDNAASFRIATFDPEEEWLKRPDLKLDIDSPADYAALAFKPLAPDMEAKEIVKLWPNRRQKG